MHSQLDIVIAGWAVSFLLLGNLSKLLLLAKLLSVFIIWLHRNLQKAQLTNVRRSDISLY